jgi:competence protein ComEC
MNRILVCFVAGAALFHLLSALPSLHWLLLLPPLAWLWRFRRLRPALALIAGGAWSMLYASWQLSHQLPPRYAGVDLLAEGVVVSLPQRSGNLVKFRLQTDRVTDATGRTIDLRRIRLNWYRAPYAVEPGQRWRLQVRLKRPRGMRNPAGFDFEQWLFAQGIQATGYVRTWRGNQRLAADDRWLGLDQLRQSIAGRIDAVMGRGVAAGLIKALTIGDRRGLDADHWQVFTRTGTNHLVAISGLHVGLVAGWLFFIGQWCWRRSERLTLRLPAIRAGAVCAMSGALVYAALAGFSLPTQRALVMLLVALTGTLAGRPMPHARSLALALFMVVLFDPLAPLSAGFWLSFGAVSLILLVMDGRLRPPRGWSQLLQIQAAVTLGLMPLLLLFFGQASVLSPLVNLLMVPWFGLVLVPISLLGLPLLLLPEVAHAWYALVSFLAQHTFNLLAWFSAQPPGMLQFAQLPDWLWLCALLGILLLMLPGGMPGRPLGLLMVVPVLFAEPARPAAGEFWFTLLDVGQGLSCVVETAGHLLVYDTGPAYASGFNAAQASLLPYLVARGQDRIDRLILSNNDQDHAGGAQAVLNAMPVESLLTGEAAPFAKARLCLGGEHWVWEGVQFTVLHPLPGDDPAKSNDRSCVLMITNGRWRLLLTGDIESEGESLLLERYGASLQAQVVVAPHHGSNTSSGEAFVRAVSPDWVLFSTGFGNRYGFPRSEVVDRWRAIGAKTLDSAQEGAIQLRLGVSGAAPVPLRYRRLRRHYWNALPENSAQAGGF